MNTYRIFTNDRGIRGGVPLYSCLKEVKATSPEVARRTCPARFDAPNYAPAVAIHWPASTQSDDEKEWLKKHVGKGSGRLMVRQHPLMAPPAARRAARPARSRVSRMTKAYRFLAFYLILALACASWKLQVGWNTFKQQIRSAWREQP